MNIKSTEIGGLPGAYEFIEALFQEALHAIIVKDSASRLCFANRSACTLLGFDLEEVLGRTDHDLLPSEEADKILAVDREIIATGSEQLFEESISAKDGSVRILEAHKRRVTLPPAYGSATVLVVALRDLTDLRRAQKVLRESEENHRALIELHPQIPWVADPAGNFIEVGAQWAQLVGRPVDEAKGTGWEAALHPDDLDLARFLWSQALGDGTRLDMEYRIAAANGEYRWCRARAAPKLDFSGKIEKWYGLLEDVHDRHIAVDALVQSRRKLREHRDQLEKLVEARTEEVEQKNLELSKLLDHERKVNALQRRFVSMISHEFRTPLAIIDGAAQRLTRTKAVVTPEFLQTKATQIKGAVARMVELMESILSAGRIETGTLTVNKQQVSLRPLIEECVARRQEISPDHQVHLELSALPESMELDPNLVERVFSNLLSNAVKYSPNTKDIYIRGWREEGFVNVDVRDMGIGVAQDEMSRLFEPYFRGANASSIAGTGIGLDIVQEIVSVHSGTISVVSDYGAGSTFTVKLPFVN